MSVSGDCWEWRGAILHGGYGAFSYNGKTHTAHRIAWLFTYGALPPSDVVVMHQCDNPLCVNPLHLKLGTDAENKREMFERGRSLSIGRKLSRSLVESIRAQYAADSVTQKELAERYGVSLRTIQALINNEYYGQPSESVQLTLEFE